MTFPSINYSDAIQIFLGAQEKDSYITHSLTSTKDKKDGAPIEEICNLAEIVIKGLQSEIIEKKTENREKLQAQIKAVRNYLIKIKDTSKDREADYLGSVKVGPTVLGLTHQIYINHFNKVEGELKELAALDDLIQREDDSIHEKESKIFSDAELSEMIKNEDFDFQKHGIKSEKTLIQIAKRAIQLNTTTTSKFIQKFGIKNQEALVDIAKLGVLHHPYGICEYIQNYGIKDQIELIEIAKLSLKNYPAFSEYIQNFGIKDPLAHIELAKFAAQQDGGASSQYIQKFGIDDQNALIAIAKLAAQHKGLSGYIQNYGIKDPKELIEIAKLAARHPSGDISNNIKNYGITDKGALIEIAMIADQHSPGDLCLYIQNYGIDNQETLIEIAKLAARHTATISRTIRNFGIKDPAAIIEIAKLAAHQNGELTSSMIQRYEIVDQGALVEIAKIAALGGNVSYHIENYGIKDPVALIEIAKLSAQQDGARTSMDIQNYGITDKNALIEIAKLAVLHGGENTRIVENYRIDNQDALIQIGKLAAQQDEWVPKYIKRLGIEDPQVLIEMAKLAAQKNGYRVSEDIKCFGIKDEIQLLEIFLLAFKNNPAGSLRNIENYNLPIFKGISKLSENSSLKDIQKAFPWPEEFSPIFKELGQEAPKKEDILFTIYLGCKLLQKPALLKNPEVWGSILQYKDDKMRYELADALFALDEKQVEFYREFSSPNHLHLPALFFCFSSQTKEEAKGYHDLLKDRREFRDGMLLKVLLDALQPLTVQHRFTNEENMRLLKTALKGHIQGNLFSIQGTLSCGGYERLKKEAQSESPDLDAAYLATFAQAIPIKPIKDFSIKYAQTFGRCALPSAPLIYAGRLRRLPKSDQEVAFPVLADYVESVLEGDYPKKRYEALRQLDKQSDKVDHLKILFDKQPSLKKDWSIDIEKPLEDYLFTTSDKISFDPKSFLNEKIKGGEHLPREKYPLLYQFLETNDSKISKGLAETLAKFADSNKERARQKVNLRNALSGLDDIEKQGKVLKMLGALVKAGHLLEDLPGIKESLSGIEKLDKSDPELLKKVQLYLDRFKKAAEACRLKLTSYDEEHQLLVLQKDLIDLYENETASLSDRLNILNKVQGKLEHSREEFLNDVNGIIEALKKQKKSLDRYTITNTDRFDLMLLCGTQVQGSCQRIDGDPNLNKCLLAYLMDGKNRLIAIKDKEGNIVARSILRLLWDKQNECPALMQERVYSNVLDASLKEALNKFALAQADRLGVAFYEADGTGDVSLDSFGGPAPWEYVDAAEGVYVYSKFTVEKTRRVKILAKA